VLVNDVWAGRADPRLLPLVAERGAAVCLVHMRGEPRTMQRDPSYGDVVREVRDWLAGRLQAALDAGVPEERVLLDPGFGFGKTLEHNLALLARLDELVAGGFPVLVGTSRKRFLGMLLAQADGLAGGQVVETDDRLEGSVASAVWAMWQGAKMVRAHDVRATVLAASRVADARNATQEQER
jgi:dihydropteroate synthase